MRIIRRSPEMLARHAAKQLQAERKTMREARRAAFAKEADPMFFQVQRGEATQADYDAKIAEIRARLPYPE